MFFLTVAAAGANMYGCASANTWSPEYGVGSGVVQVENTGTLVGSRPILDFTNGQGILLAISDTGQAISIQTALDTSYAQTLAGQQAGSAVLCASASGSGTTYTCALSPVLAVYTAGMALNWKPDVNGTGGPTTLAVNILSAAAVKLSDGVTDPGPGDIVAGRILEIWYDGTVFRLVNPPIPEGILGEVQPTCAAGIHGRLWFVAGATGVKDGLSVCAKDATNTYAWRALY